MEDPRQPAVLDLDHGQQRQLHLYIIAVCRERSTALESLETSFHQDLNGDGVIGIPAPAT